MLTNVAYGMLTKKVDFSITSQQMPGIKEEGSFKTNIICATNEILMIEWEAVCAYKVLIFGITLTCHYCTH